LQLHSEILQHFSFIKKPVTASVVMLARVLAEVQAESQMDSVEPLQLVNRRPVTSLGYTWNTKTTVIEKQVHGNYFLTGGSKSRGPHFEEAPLNPAPQCGLGRSPSWNRILCVLAL